MMSWQESLASYLMGMGIGMFVLLLGSFLPACFCFKWTRMFVLEFMGLGVVMIGASVRVILASLAVETGDVLEVLDTAVIVGGVALLTVGLTRAHARRRAMSAGQSTARRSYFSHTDD
jgi:uncharacterized membrane protein